MEQAKSSGAKSEKEDDPNEFGFFPGVLALPVGMADAATEPVASVKIEDEFETPCMPMAPKVEVKEEEEVDEELAIPAASAEKAFVPCLEG